MLFVAKHGRKVAENSVILGTFYLSHSDGMNCKVVKGKYHANLLSFQNPKMFVCQ